MVALDEARMYKMIHRYKIKCIDANSAFFPDTQVAEFVTVSNAITCSS